MKLAPVACAGLIHSLFLADRRAESVRRACHCRPPLRAGHSVPFCSVAWPGLAPELWSRRRENRTMIGPRGRQAAGRAIVSVKLSQSEVAQQAAQLADASGRRQVREAHPKAGRTEPKPHPFQVVVRRQSRAHPARRGSKHREGYQVCFCALRRADFSALLAVACFSNTTHLPQLAHFLGRLCVCARVCLCACVPVSVCVPVCACVCLCQTGTILSVETRTLLHILKAPCDPTK